MRVGINGFGRMGRLALRAAWDSPDLEFVAVNEPCGDAESLTLLLEFDSLRGRFHLPCTGRGSSLAIGEKTKLPLHQVDTPSEIPWGDYGVELVLECSGRFRDAGSLTAHLERGVAQVLVSAPLRDHDTNIVFGVNDSGFDLAREAIVSAASCTTNRMAPIARVVHDTFGITRGMVTAIHAPTNTQEVIDHPQRNPRRARSASQHRIPTSTNSAYAVTLILPELAGKLDSVAVRNPCLNASLVDCVFQLERDTDLREVTSLFRDAASKAPLRGVLGIEERPLVSDFSGDPRRAIVDAPSLRITDGSMLKVLAWYDNEWGYVRRMIDLAEAMARAPAS